MIKPVRLGSFVAGLLAATACVGMAIDAHADELHVMAPSPECKTNEAGRDYCSIGEAITAANARAGSHVIRLAHGAVYTLDRSDHDDEGGNGLPAIAGNLIIEGDGSTIERSQAKGIVPFRLFHVLPRGELTLRQLTLRHGTTGLGFDGAAIWNRGTLTVASCVLEDNHSGDDGGAIRSDGSLLVQDSFLRRNSALSQGRLGGVGGVGGAIQSHTQFGKGRTRIERTVFEGNQADASGGALWLMGDTAMVQATVIGNRAGERGGGIMNYGTLDLRRSRVVDNQARDAGGGIYAFGPATVADTELTRNRAGEAGDCDGQVRGCGTNVVIGIRH